MRKGPGLLLRDIRQGEDTQIAAVIEVIATTRPDILTLQGFDYDLTGAALAAFADQLALAGHEMSHVFANRPNAGMPTGLDMDGNGRLGEPRDAQGYGRFSGQGGMAVLSRFPILTDKVQDYSALVWRDLPGARLPRKGDQPFPSAEVQAIQRLSSQGHWVVPVDVPGTGVVSILTFHATPPVFDGPEDRNGLRNHDEAAFWTQFLDGGFGPAPDRRFVLMGDANMDITGSEGLPGALAALLADPRLQDPRPTGPDGRLRTVDWPDPTPGDLRVDYVLPSADWRIDGAAVHWLEGSGDASRHRLVWVDIAPPS